MVEFLRQVFGIVFYGLFFVWLFLKVNNVLLIYKMKCKDKYNEIKKNIKNCKTPKILKYVKTFIIVLPILIALYIGSLVFSLALILMILIITGFGIALETAELIWLKYILAFLYLYLNSFFKYGIYIVTFVVYIIIYSVLVMGLYSECIRYNELKKVKEN